MLVVEYAGSRISSVQSPSHVRLFVTPWITVHQASLSIINSQSSLKLMSIELVMPSSHLILYRPLLLLPPIRPSIRVFSDGSTLRMRWPKYWSFSFSIIWTSNSTPEYNSNWTENRYSDICTPVLIFTVHLVFWPGEFHGLYSLWGCKELDTTERLSLTHLFPIPPL